MQDCIAYSERPSMDPITGEDGILRKEWRVNKVSTFAPSDLDAAWGPDWRRFRPFAEYVLEVRYIRRGTVEPWQPFEAANSPEQAMQGIDGGSSVVLLHPYLIALEEQRRAADATRKAEALAALDAEVARRDQASRMLRAQDCFRRMLESPRYSELANRWNCCASNASEELKAAVQGEAMDLYLAVMESDKVPSKAKAIKAFLAWAQSKGLATVSDEEQRP